MKLHIIDSHTHVQFPEYDSDRGEVMRRALNAGIGMINAGTDEKSSKQAVELAEAHEYGVWATVGIHPHEAATHADWKRTSAELEKLVASNKVVGIGECGFDFFRMEEGKEKETKEKQKELFELQIEIAHMAKKPLVIHTRDAFEDTCSILSRHRSLLSDPAGIIHFFTGTKEQAQKYMDLGFSFTFGGLMTFNREFDEMLAYVPADRMLLETDAPFVSPQSKRGKRNEPHYIEEIAQFMSEFKKCDPGVFLDNTVRVFRLRL